MSALLKVKIDGVEIEVAPGTTILQACEEMGAEIPRFCYHERLSVAGNCRMCLVAVAGNPKPVASCAVPVVADMEIDTKSAEVQSMRKGVMEFLLINHPLDCPICDQGGECDLQDQALGYGYEVSRFADNKRAVEEKYMGPLVKTIMTRCIHCTRCVRFATEIAGVPEIGTIGRGEDMEITTYLEASLASELSGNVIDLCPVGALTAKPYAFMARAWELTKTETIDVMDAVGSNIRVDTRDGKVMRILPRNHDEINEEWLSDKSRFVFDGLHCQRLDTPYIRENGKLKPTNWETVFTALAVKLKAQQASDNKGANSKIAAIAGDLACAESMFALQGLMAQLASPHLDCRQDGAKLPNDMRSHYLFNTTIAGIEQADALLIIGANPRKEAAVLNARIRKRWLQGNFPIGLIGTNTDLTYPVTHLGNGLESLLDVIVGEHKFAKMLQKARRPMLILGQAALTVPTVHAAALELARTMNMLQDDWNGFNILHNAAARVAGLDLNFLPAKGGRDVEGILQGCESGDIEIVFLLGADEVDMQRLKKSFVIYIGSHGDAGAQAADIILPAAAYTEKSAIYVNTEGRVQMTQRALFPPREAREDWKIFRALSAILGQPLPYDTLDDLRAAMFKQVPHFAQLDAISPAQQPIVESTSPIPDSQTKQSELPLERVSAGQASHFKQAYDDFYLTNPIARASATMGACSRQSMQMQTQAQKGTGTDG